MDECVCMCAYPISISINLNVLNVHKCGFLDPCRNANLQLQDLSNLFTDECGRFEPKKQETCT